MKKKALAVILVILAVFSCGCAKKEPQTAPKETSGLKTAAEKEYFCAFVARVKSNFDFVFIKDDAGVQQPVSVKTNIDFMLFADAANNTVAFFPESEKAVESVNGAELVGKSVPDTITAVLKPQFENGANTESASLSVEYSIIDNGPLSAEMLEIFLDNTKNSLSPIFGEKLAMSFAIGEPVHNLRGFPSVCTACLGTGIRQCNTCHNEKFVNCPICEKSKLMLCPNCGGLKIDYSGMPIEETEPCSVCGGAKRVPCNVCPEGVYDPSCELCHGTHLMLCGNCNGLGYTVKQSTENVFPPCSYCSGTGQVPCDCTYGIKPGMVICGACDGQSGEKCRVCDGLGKFVLESPEQDVPQ